MDSDFYEGIWYNICKEKSPKRQKSLQMGWRDVQISEQTDEIIRFRAANGGNPQSG